MNLARFAQNEKVKRKMQKKEDTKLTHSGWKLVLLFALVSPLPFLLFLFPSALRQSSAGQRLNLFIAASAFANPHQRGLSSVRNRIFDCCAFTGLELRQYVIHRVEGRLTHT